MERIAQILGKMNGGGVEQMVMNYYRAIDKTQVQYDFYIFSSSKYVPFEEIKSLGGKIFLLPSFRHPIKYLRTMKKLLSEKGYKIVHCHLSTLSFLPLFAAKRAGVPVRIVHSHSTAGGSEYLRNIAKAFLKPLARHFATDYVACSQLAAKYMFGSLPPVKLNEAAPKKCVRIIPNAIDTAAFSFSESARSTLRGEFKIPSKTLLFGHIGRFCPQKNQSFLIDIFVEIVKQHKNSRLLLVGTGADMEYIMARVSAHQLSDKVIFAGQRSDTDKIYSALDCFVMPSNYEGLPVVGVEAQCAGVYCLFSDKITKEAKIADNAQYLSLKTSAKDWACAAICCAKLHNEKAAAQVRESGFEITQAAQELCKFYLSK